MKKDRIGCFAVSMAGHDRAECYVIVRDEGRAVYVTDGKHHPLTAVKKKNSRHLEIRNTGVAEETVERIRRGDVSLTDAEIRSAIKNYQNRSGSREKQGGQNV